MAFAFFGKLGESLELFELRAAWLFGKHVTPRFQCRADSSGRVYAFHRHDGQRGPNLCQHFFRVQKTIAVKTSTKLSPRPFQSGLVGNRDGYRPYTLSGSEDFKVTADMRCRWLNDKADVDLVAGIGRIQSARDDRNE